MKTIAIDCRFAATNSGLGRYTRELTTHLLSRDGFRYVLFVRSPEENWIPSRSSHFTVVTADVPHYSIAEQVVLPGLLRDFPADLFFSPHFNVPFSCPVPFLVTIHDLILHRYPNQASFFKRRAYRSLFSNAIKKATRIITISPFVKSEIASVFGTSAESKTRVVLEGVDPAFHPSPQPALERIRDKYALKRPYFLYVGNAKQHKNVPLLIQAFLASGRQMDADLILVTGGKESEALRPLPDHVRQLKDVPDSDLPALYSAANALVTASLYEGFCLPVAEALACACPVIATDGSAIRDIATGKALLLEPTVDAFAAAFKHPPHERNASVIGTWENTAEETAAVLQEAM
ncbi:MAG TPA: glycosyltransferase family 1 protein [Candidatus Peribacteraceae bacterium]|nr:glycosyltransferase family 1 protein [Candidatus Peribacteraceae bacterium]